jgi:hypothetical protein
LVTTTNWAASLAVDVAIASMVGDPPRLPVGEVARKTGSSVTSSATATLLPRDSPEAVEAARADSSSSTARLATVDTI